MTLSRGNRCKAFAIAGQIQHISDEVLCVEEGSFMFAPNSVRTCIELPL